MLRTDSRILQLPDGATLTVTTADVYQSVITSSGVQDPRLLSGKFRSYAREVERSVRQPRSRTQ